MPAPSVANRQRRVDAQLQSSSLTVGAYDRVASMLLSLLITFGALVTILFSIWLTVKFIPQQSAQPVILDNLAAGGRPDGTPGESLRGDPSEPPDPGEIARETDLDEPPIQETMTTVLDAVAMTASSLEEPQLDDPLDYKSGGSPTGTGNRAGFGRGTGTGNGDGDGPGSGFPRSQRWVIQFAEGATPESYAAQLDFFGIELGVIGNSSQITYAYNLRKPKADVTTLPGSQEKRLYFTWKEGNLKAADLKLMANAGIVTAGKVIVQFYPASVENDLAVLEQNYAKRDAAEIRRTRFGVRPAGKGYQFYVIDQTYLR